MALEATLNTELVHRVVIEEYPEGVYVIVYYLESDPYDSPSEDHLQDNWSLAKKQALLYFGVEDSQWREIPDTNFNGPK